VTATPPPDLPRKRPLRTLGLVLHPQRDTSAVLSVVRRWAADSQVALLGLKEEYRRLPDDVAPAGEDELGGRSDLILGVGGDGTVLRALSLAAPHDVPVLGVNLGRLGFLAEVDVEQLVDALLAIARGDYQLERRAALQMLPPVGPAELPDARHPIVAYNDVVVARTPGCGQAAIALWVDGEVFARYSADAVLVSTPTGSTAYNFSAGGPIVSPRLNALIVTPVAPHSVFNRALVLDPREHVELEVLRGSGPLTVEVDGRVAGRVHPGARVAFRVGDHDALVVRVGESSFAGRTRRKLRLTDPVALDR
jgi:NAD+ kinase